MKFTEVVSAATLPVAEKQKVAFKRLFPESTATPTGDDGGTFQPYNKPSAVRGPLQESIAKSTVENEGRFQP